jgi:hypothetical protein
MISLRRPIVLLLVLPALHIFLCIMIEFSSSYGSMAWFPMYFVDLPLSHLLMRIDWLPPVVSFGFFGTIWWFLIGALIRFIFTRTL